MTIVDFVGGYFGKAFKFFWGVIQRGALSPNIFNVVVYAVVRQWVSLVDGGAGVPDG